MFYVLPGDQKGLRRPQPGASRGADTGANRSAHRGVCPGDGRLVRQECYPGIAYSRSGPRRRDMGVVLGGVGLEDGEGTDPRHYETIVSVANNSASTEFAYLPRSQRYASVAANHPHTCPLMDK